MKKLMQVVVASVALLLLICLPASSQSLELGHISGVVTDQTGGVIAGAMVNVIDVARNVSRPLVSDASGLYSAPSLTAGTYTVHVEAPGFKALDRQNVIVGVGAEVRVDVTLQPGAQNQTVTVTESLPIMNTTNTVISSDLDAQQIADLPVNGRLYTHLLDFEPAIQGPPGGNASSAYSMNGMSGQQNDWLFDGVEDVNQFVDAKPLIGSATSSVNGELTILPLDAVGQVSLLSNPSAEFGWQLGAHTNVGLKSGTNSLHGSGFAYGRDTLLDANNQFTKIGANGLAQARPVDELEQFGGSVGGPIKKDKLFYFGSYEGMRYDVGSPTTASIATTASLGYNIGGAGVGVQTAPTNSTTFSIPDAINQLANANGVTPNALSLALAGCTTTGAAATILPKPASAGPPPVAAVAGNGTLVATCTPTALFANGSTTTTNFPLTNALSGHSDNQITKTDWHPNDHNAVNGEYFFGHSNTNVPLSTVQAPAAKPIWNQVDRSTTQAVRAVWVYTPSANWVNEARFGWDYYHMNNGNSDCAADGVTSTLNYQALYGFISGSQPNYGSCGFPTVTSGGGTLGASSAAGDQHVLQHTWHLIDALSNTRGKHQLKFGGEFHKTLYNGTGAPASADGAITFAGNKSFNGATALEDFLAGEPGSATVLIGDISTDIHLYRYAAYIQDDYRASRNVTVNMGMRYEYSPPIAEEHGRFGNFDATTTSGMVQQKGTTALYSTSRRNFGPRLGVSWDVTGKGTTVIRAGGSVVFGGLQIDNIAANGFGAGLDSVPTGFGLIYCSTVVDPHGQPCSNAGNGLVTVASPGTNTEGLLSLTNNCAQGIANLNAACNQIAWAQNTAVFPNGAGAEYCGDGLAQVMVAGVLVTPSQCALFVFPKYQPTSYVTTWTVSIQHAFTSSTSLNVAYVGNHGSDLNAELNINQASCNATTQACFNNAEAQSNAALSPGSGGGGSTYIAPGGAAVPGITSAISRRPYNSIYPYLGGVSVYGPGGVANYAGLQTTLIQRATHGLTFNADYTWAHALASTTGGNNPTVMNTYNIRQNYGSGGGAFHHFAITNTYVVPTVKSLSFFGEGWQISNAINFLSGRGGSATCTGVDFAGIEAGSYQCSDAFYPGGSLNDFSKAGMGYVGLTGTQCYAAPQGQMKSTGCTTVGGAGAVNYPQICITAAANEPVNAAMNAIDPGISSGLLELGYKPGSPSTAANISTTGGQTVGGVVQADYGCWVSANGLAALLAPAQGTYGNMTKNQILGAPFSEWDLSVVKNTKITERVSAQFRAEFYNVLNVPSFTGGSAGAITSSTFGRSTSTPNSGNNVNGTGGQRLLQLALRLSF